MNKSIKIFLLSFISIIFVFNLANVVFGAGSDLVCKKSGTPNQPYPWCDATELQGKSGLINTIYNYSLVLVGVVALGAIIYGGILYTMSAGNPSGQTEATQWITGAIWGLILLLGAALLFNTINPEIVSLKLSKLKSMNINMGTSMSKNSGYNNLSNQQKQDICVKRKNKNECEKDNNCFWTRGQAAELNIKAGKGDIETDGTCAK